MNKMAKLRPIMFVGTGSDVGKSVINAAFCRIFKQDGYCPAPFKAQNMSLNSFPTAAGLEIGRAQAMQAEACGIECSSDMNPILLKPTSHKSSQLVLNGKTVGNKTASEYFLKTDRDWLFSEAMNAYYRLHGQYKPIVIEGAGSISEINLWDKDITNMKVAVKADAAVYLIADIDRGGVIASVYGTIQLLPEHERKLIKGIIINKFRGDISLFLDGKQIIEKLTGIPVVGIIPWFQDIFIDDEDSVVIDSKQQMARDNQINIAVVLLRHMSNFTDFNYLERMPEVHLYYAANPSDLEKADIVIIPGSKNSISDMQYLRHSGMAKAILDAHAARKAVYGICGGYQMMGTEIRDPLHVEGEIECIPGLGILPVKTTLSSAKITEQRGFTFLDLPGECKGYEIHMGESVSDHPSWLCQLSNNQFDGHFLNPKTWGTYLHGIFDNEVVLTYILQQAGLDKQISLMDHAVFKDQQYDKLAQWVRDNIAMDSIYQSLQL
jgi:adenosylcobyric acid synthase